MNARCAVLSGQVVGVLSEWKRWVLRRWAVRAERLDAESGESGWAERVGL